MKRFLAYLISLILTSWLLTSFIYNSQNNLVQNNQWIGHKKNLKFYVMGSDEFLLSRATLSKNQLNLSKFWGYQTIQSKRTFIPAKGSFNFEVPEHSYLNISFKLPDGSYVGVRLSRLTIKPSALFKINEEFEFIEKTPIPVNIVSGWNEMIFSYEKGQLKFSLNRKSIPPIELTLTTPAPIHFHAGIKGASIDNIEICEVSGECFNENFVFKSPTHLLHFGLSFLIVTLLVEVFSFLMGFFNNELANDPLYRRVFAIANTFSLLVTIYLFDYFYLSSIEFFNQTRDFYTKDKVAVNFIEKYRFSILRKYSFLTGMIEDERELFKKNSYLEDRIWDGPLICSSNNDNCESLKTYVQLENRFLNKNLTNCRKVFLIGGSQSVGSGAHSIEGSLFGILHKRLNNRLSNKCLVSVNLSGSGQDIIKVRRKAEEFIRKNPPDLVIFNIGTNDNTNEFKESLPSFLAFLSDIGARSVLFKEANSYLYQSDIAEKHQVIEKVGNQFNVPVFDLHSYMEQAQKKDLGTLWLDFVHMTSFGQSLAANWMHEQLIAVEAN